MLSSQWVCVFVCDFLCGTSSVFLQVFLLQQNFKLVKRFQTSPTKQGASGVTMWYRCIYIYISISWHRGVYMYRCTYMCTYAFYSCTYIYVYMYIYIYAHARKYMYVHIYVYVYMYTQMSIHTHIPNVCVNGWIEKSPPSKILWHIQVCTSMKTQRFMYICM